MSTRIKSAAVAIVIAVILLIAHGTFLFNIAVGAISALAIYEIFRATKMTEHKYQTIACCAFAFVDAFMPVFYRHGWLYFFSYKLYMGLFVIAMCLLYLKEHTKFQYTEFFFMLGVGCEVIAAYNYLTYEGFEPDMAKLAYDFEKNALIAADGSLGSNPRKISGLFKAMGVGYKRFYKADEAQAAVEEGKPVIVSFHIGLNVFSGIHTVFAVKEEGRLYVYNCYNSAADKTEVESIYQLMNKNSLFIVGYTEDDGQMR